MSIIRSSALNNIPRSKVQSQIQSVFRACDSCSKKSNLSSGISILSTNIDGACTKCAMTVMAINRFEESNIPIEYWKLSMDKDFVGDPKLLEVYRGITSDIRANFTNGIFLFFAGTNGLGKTFSLVSILKHAALKGYSCTYTTLSDIVSVFLQAPNEEKYAARRELTMVDFLVIDEVDQRFFGNSDQANDLFARTLESVLRTRTQNKLPLFMATNSPNIQDTFKSLFKDSLSSLLSNATFIYVAPGKDFRKVLGAAK